MPTSSLRSIPHRKVKDVQIERYLSVDLAAARAPYEAALAELTRTRAIERMWAHDPSLWKPDPADDVELSNRLGWLTLPEDFAPRAAELEQLAVDTVQAEIADVVVCGMGGSSLAPEVFRQTFGGPHRSPGAACARLHRSDRAGCTGRRTRSTAHTAPDLQQVGRHARGDVVPGALLGHIGRAG